MILEALSSLANGGLFGFIGAGIQKFADFQTEKLRIAAKKDEYLHELNMKEADAKIMAQEWAARTQIVSTETEGKIETKRFEAMEEAIKAEGARFSEGVKPTVKQAWLLFILDWIRGAVRPAISYYLIGLTTAMWWHVHKIVQAYGQVLPVQQAVDLETEIIKMVLSMTSGCISFWFLTRSKDKK